jgi:transcriptional regulator with XRE-family HTH domain
MPKLMKLRAVREQRALSQAELAAATGVAQPTLSRLERGVDSARGRTVRKLAAALKVKPVDLYGDGVAS